MAATSYDASLQRLLIHEGGYSNHPADPGGPTNFGITIGDYRRYVKPDATASDVRAMRLEEAKAIYRSKYWDAMRCDDLPAGLDYAVFDYGVNSGIGRAGNVLRRILHLPATTSSVTGDVTRAAEAVDAKQAIAALCDERLTFLQHLRTWPVFGRGWGRRVAEVKAAALAMADAAGKGAKAPAASAPGKGAAKPKNAVRNSTIGGAVVAGGAAVAPSHGTAITITVLIMTIVIAVGAWFFWRWRHRQKQEAPVKN